MQKIALYLPITSIIYRIEIHEFFTEDAGKTWCSSVGISSGCSLWLKKCPYKKARYAKSSFYPLLNT